MFQKNIFIYLLITYGPIISKAFYKISRCFKKKYIYIYLFIYLFTYNLWPYYFYGILQDFSMYKKIYKYLFIYLCIYLFIYL